MRPSRQTIEPAAINFHRAQAKALRDEAIRSFLASAATLLASALRRRARPSAARPLGRGLATP